MTANQRLFKCALWVAVAAGLDRQLPELNSDHEELGSLVDDCVEVAGRHFEADAQWLSLNWPLGERSVYSRGRAYAHVFGADLRGVAFVKFFAPGEPRERAENEAETLRLLGDDRSARLRVPRLIAEGTTRGGRRYVATAPLPHPVSRYPARAGYPSDLVAAYQGSHTNPPDVLPPWWPSRVFADHQHACRLAASVPTSAAVGEARLAVVHGDFAPKNLFVGQDCIWLTDWERSSREGPVLADEVSYFLSIRPRLVQRKPAAAVRALRLHFKTESNPERLLDLALALAYLVYVGSRDAERVVPHW
jgi:hypothetical protein